MAEQTYTCEDVEIMFLERIFLTISAEMDTISTMEGAADDKIPASAVDELMTRIEIKSQPGKSNSIKKEGDSDDAR